MTGVGGSGYLDLADVTAPSAPTGLAVTSYYGGAKLSWTANSESDLAEYYVYYSTDNSTYTKYSDEPTTNSYTATGGTIGTLYYYKVSAVDESGNESSKSDAVSIKARGAWWVDLHNGDNDNDGKSESTAFKTIHEAFDNSSLADGDSIKVKPSITSTKTKGTIVDGEGDGSAYNFKNDVIDIGHSRNFVLIGTGGADSTVFNAGGSGRHFYLDDGQSSSTVIKGITFRAGEEDGYPGGGSIWIYATDIQFVNCVWDSNRVVDDANGGGDYH